MYVFFGIHTLTPGSAMKVVAYKFKPIFDENTLFNKNTVQI